MLRANLFFLAVIVSLIWVGLVKEKRVLLGIGGFSAILYLFAVAHRLGLIDFF